MNNNQFKPRKYELTTERFIIIVLFIIIMSIYVIMNNQPTEHILVQQCIDQYTKYIEGCVCQNLQ